MRFALLALALAGCAGSSHEAAWPKSHASETDGGESLAPHEAKVIVAAVKTDDDAKPAAPAAVVTPAATTETAPVVAPPAAATEEAIQAEEIIIEIDD